MNVDVKNALGDFFSLIWNIFASITIPGTNLSALVVLVAPLGVAAIITAIRKLTDIGGLSSTNIMSIKMHNRKQTFHSQKKP